MKIGKLREVLSGYPDDMEIVAGIEPGDDCPKIELRDMLDRDTSALLRTVLHIRNCNYGRLVGHPHLTAKERQTKRAEILSGLADVLRPEKWATRRFTNVHGDCRIYHHHNHHNDTCYGTAYDPRLFAELEADGLVASRPGHLSRVPEYYITEKGMETLRPRPHDKAEG